MHLKMTTMAEPKVIRIDDDAIKLSDNEAKSDNLHMDKDGSDNSSEVEDVDLTNTDGRLSSTTFVIQMDNKCEDLVDIDIAERERLAHENCDVGDDEISDNDEELDCLTSHIPLNNDVEVSGESPFNNEHFGVPVPTPSELGVLDILSDDNDYTDNIKQKKYPVLPSIGKRSNGNTPRQEDSSDDDPTINQLDFTRERMETEADFFADYRVNTSKIKPTPRNAPLPPIGQTFSPGREGS